jgi:WD40 repeat protein
MGNGAAKKDKTKTWILQTCDEHEGSINCMDLSDDASVLATGSDDKTIRLWSTKTDNIDCIGILEGHEDYVTSVTIVDNFVVSTSADKSIRKWDMSTCECLMILKGHTSTVNKVICTGDFIFSISYDKTARCWDIDTGECIRVFIGHKGNISSILFIPAEIHDTQDVVKFVNENKNKKSSLHVPTNHNSLGIALNDEENEQQEVNEDELYSKDLVITGSLDSTAKSWSFETGECIHTFKDHNAAITCMATDQVGNLLFTGSSDHTIRSWDIMKGQLLKVFEGHQTTIINIVVSILFDFFIIS